MSSMLRSLARNRAKERMHTKGMRRICKDAGRRSFFSRNWRAYAFPVTIKGGKKK